nr:MAG TPA: hypothetical protein [Caudoviricetes sp.]
MSRSLWAASASAASSVFFLMAPILFVKLISSQSCNY